MKVGRGEMGCYKEEEEGDELGEIGEDGLGDIAEDEVSGGEMNK